MLQYDIACGTIYRRYGLQQLRTASSTKSCERCRPPEDGTYMPLAPSAKPGEEERLESTCARCPVMRS